MQITSNPPATETPIINPVLSHSSSHSPFPGGAIVGHSGGSVGSGHGSVGSGQSVPSPIISSRGNDEISVMLPSCLKYNIILKMESLSNILSLTLSNHLSQ